MRHERESIRRGPRGGRSLEDHEEELNREFRGFHGKKVLEIGAGSELRFARELKERGIHADVTALSPAFADEDVRMHALHHAPENAVLVAGLAEALPFPDETFDDVVSLHVAEHLNEEQFKALITESFRVLKPGGTLEISPIYDDAELLTNTKRADIQTLVGTRAEIEWRRPAPKYATIRLPDSTGYKQIHNVYVLTIRKKIEGSA